jgi:hypothetical protein
MTTPLDDDLDLAIQAGSPRLGGQHQHGRGVAPDVARWAPNRALLAAQPADGGCRSCEMRDMPPRPGDFMLDEHVPLKEYLDAHAGYAEADAAFDRAGAVFEELAERTGDDDRAYEMAGMTLADHRMLAAFKAMHEAGEQLARTRL